MTSRYFSDAGPKTGLELSILTMMGNANHFKNYGNSPTDDPKQLEYGTKRFVGEVNGLAGVMDAQLSTHVKVRQAREDAAKLASS